MEVNDNKGISGYAISEGNTGGAFQIDTNGNITTAGLMDYEAVSNYQLVIEVTDTSDNVASANLVVNVLDLDERAPVISDSAVSTSETNRPGAEVVVLNATHSSGISNYRFIGGNTDNAFAIDNDGRITVAGPLEYETTPTYYLTVEVRANEPSASNAQATVTININDENAPLISDLTTNIVENSPVNTPVVLLDATHSTGISNYRFIGGNTDNAFAIIDTNGRITVVGALDYETPPNRYDLTVEVRANESSAPPAQAIITINVTDDPDDNPPMISDLTVNILENSPSNTLVVLLNATHSTGISNYRFIGGNTDNLFAIDTNGRITVVGDLDYETPPNRYDLTVEVIANGPLAPPAQAIITVLVDNEVDEDGNGLIEILDLTMLHQMRYNLAGTSYKMNNVDAGNSFGCPGGTCEGYELVSNLSFDTDGDGTWSGSNGSYTLDSDDNHPVYFNVSEGGWEPIGWNFFPFTGIFDGQGFTITGLAIIRNRDDVGMFGGISGSGIISNLGLVSNLSDSGNGSYAASLVCWQDGGSIIASYATGPVNGGNIVGGLVGRQGGGGSIIASYTTGPVNGSRFNIGGLVGRQDGGSIIASYATGPVNGGGSNVGGLVGSQRVEGIHEPPSITASYATGSVTATNRRLQDFIHIGGLVGRQDGGSITASYATGNVTAVSLVGVNLVYAGGLVGLRLVSNTSITASYATGSVTATGGISRLAAGLVGDGTNNIMASYGFGSVSGSSSSGSGTDGNPPVSSADMLTETNVGEIWTNASFPANAWSFGDGAPKLFYNDYDGSGSEYGCSGSPAIMVPDCGNLLSGQ